MMGLEIDNSNSFGIMRDKIEHGDTLKDTKERDPEINDFSYSNFPDNLGEEFGFDPCIDYSIESRYERLAACVAYPLLEMHTYFD